MVRGEAIGCEPLREMKQDSPYSWQVPRSRHPKLTMEKDMEVAVGSKVTEAGTGVTCSTERATVAPNEVDIHATSVVEVTGTGVMAVVGSVVGAIVDTIQASDIMEIEQSVADVFFPSFQPEGPRWDRPKRKEQEAHGP